MIFNLENTEVVRCYYTGQLTKNQNTEGQHCQCKYNTKWGRQGKGQLALLHAFLCTLNRKQNIN